MTLAERANPGAFVRLLDWTPPAAGAEVMGTGIVSVALSLDGSETLSRILLVIAGLTWLALAAIIPLRAWRFRERVRADAASSSRATGRRASTSFARVWVWIAVAVWAVVLVAMLYRGIETAR